MFFFVLAGLARTSISIGLLDRPLVAAMLFGFATDTLEFALPLGAVLELFWLDILRLGAIIPPSGTLAFLLAFPLCLLFELHTADKIVIPLLLCLPLAYTVQWVEFWQRKKANAYISDVENWVENPQHGLSPQKIIYKSLLLFILLEALLYIILFVILYSVFLKFNMANLSIANVNWTILFCTSLMGATLALRIKRAYTILTLALICAFLW